MKLTTPRRLGALVAVGMLGALLPMTSGPAGAVTASQTYTCALPQGKSSPITVIADTNAPANVVPGGSLEPTLTSAVTFPAAFIKGLRDNGFTGIQGTGGKSTITTNGAATAVTHTFPKKALTANESVTVLVTGKMAKLTPTETVTYRTGATTFDLALSGGFNVTINASCTFAPGNASAVIDTVTVSNNPPPPPAVVKASSTISTGVKYVKRTDKLTVAGKVTAKPTQAVAGKVKFVLYKKGKKVRSVTKTIGKANTAKTTFTGKIKKGTYVLVATYQGSSKVKSATTTRTIKIKR